MTTTQLLAGTRLAAAQGSRYSVVHPQAELKPFGNAVKGVERIILNDMGDIRWYGTATLWRVAPDGSIYLAHKPISPPEDCSTPASCGG